MHDVSLPPDQDRAPATIRGARASLPRTPLGFEMNAVCAELEMVSGGTTQSYGSTSAAATSDVQPDEDRPRRDDESWLPPGEKSPPHLRYREMFVEASTDARRFALIQRARDELDALRGYTARDNRPTLEPEEKQRQELDARIIREGVGWSAKDVARHFHVQPREVERLRKTAGRRLDDGTPVVSRATLSKNEKAQEARRLRAENPSMSNRGIAMTLGISARAVDGYLNDRAA